MAKKFQTDSPDDIGPMIAQFYCELAEQQLTTFPNNVAALLKQANTYDRNCIRATLLEAHLLMSNHNYRKALKTLLRVEQQNSHYIPETLSKLLECHQQVNSLPAFDNWLRSLLSRHPNMTSVRLMLTHIIQLQHGSQAAQLTVSI